MNATTKDPDAPRFDPEAMAEMDRAIGALVREQHKAKTDPYSPNAALEEATITPLRAFIYGICVGALVTLSLLYLGSEIYYIENKIEQGTPY